MKIKINYKTESDRRLELVANDIAEDITSDLRPVHKRIDLERVVVTLMFGTDPMGISVAGASENLHEEIRKLLAAFEVSFK